MKTLSLQTSYDTKLNNATYDALKAFQLNTINSDTSDLTNSKLRDIEASANTFFNSIASNFNMAGYNQDILAEYVPALVYTMYDGYYIYSQYTNTLDDTNQNKVTVLDENNEQKEIVGSDAELSNPSNPQYLDTTYQQGERLSGIKPYVFYSCRYQYNGNDFVITYSLDNYITIQGQIGGKWVNDGGYLLDNVGQNGTTYRNISIEQSEDLKECIDDTKTEYPYLKINGVKYYKDTDGTWFSLLNGTKYKQPNFKDQSDAGKRYYKEANDFKNKIMNVYKLEDLTADCAVDENGKKLVVLDEEGNPTAKPKFGNDKIFDFGDMNRTSIEDPNSNFNQHRLEVIRYSIEKNLSIAIANYNKFSGADANFQMPKLKEDEWEKIINNVSIISFLQGLNIGGKIYNGYSIITNNKNEEVVNEDSIYMVTYDGQYHRANDNDLVNNNNIVEGVLNIDFERKSRVDESTGVTKYFVPKQYNSQAITGCYTSIVNQNNVNATDNFYKYMAEKGGLLAQKYFTALGRERYSLYKTNVDPEKAKAEFLQPQ